MLAIAAIVVIGVVRGPESGLTTGDMVGFMFLTYRFLEPVAEFTELVDQTQTAVAGWRRVLGTLDSPARDPRPAQRAASPARTAAHRGRAHLVPLPIAHGAPRRSLPPALDDVSFTIEPATSVDRRRHRLGQDDTGQNASPVWLIPPTGGSWWAASTCAT